MLIQTYENGYKVISHVLTNLTGEIYICRDVSGDGEYTILRVTDKRFLPEFMIYLTTRVHQNIFTDFVEYFSYEDDFYVVLKHAEGTSLAEKLKIENCSLKERLKIGEKLCERMVLLDMPTYFQLNCLKLERIIVKPGLDVVFNYVPEDIRNFAHADDDAVIEAFCVVFEKLFPVELLKQLAPPINEFYRSLKKEQHFDSIELYKQYRQMSREVESIPEDEIQKPKSWLFVLWEKIKRSFKVLRKFLAVVLILVALCYLVYTIYRFFNPVCEEKRYFENIGTVVIGDSRN